jgi:hypothetical protein
MIIIFVANLALGQEARSTSMEVVRGGVIKLHVINYFIESTFTKEINAKYKKEILNKIFLSLS